MFKKLLVGVILGMLVSSHAVSKEITIYWPGMVCRDLTVDPYNKELLARAYIGGMVSGMNSVNPEWQVVVPYPILFAYVQVECRDRPSMLLYYAVHNVYYDLVEMVK